MNLDFVPVLLLKQPRMFCHTSNNRDGAEQHDIVCGGMQDSVQRRVFGRKNAEVFRV